MIRSTVYITKLICTKKDGFGYISSLFLTMVQNGRECKYLELLCNKRMIDYITRTI